MRDAWGADAGEAAAGKGNLPLPLTSFVGREPELVRARGLLAATRLLTLTGPGGVGKTRLAIEVARGLVGAYREGVWLVELAPVTEPELVPRALADALGIPERAGEPLAATLVDRLSERQPLVVLDNCEHLVAACAALAEALLGRCPGVRLLATSREPLGVPGETTLPVAPLPVPGQDATAAETASTPAARLFLERARAANPDFAVTPRNAAAVAEVCRRLDGIPLALELAAARVRGLPVEQIAAWLDEAFGPRPPVAGGGRFRLLGGGARTALPRHQTLRAVVDWSYTLLPEADRRLFEGLAVFAGSFALAAAEAVCRADGDEPVLDGLLRLVDRSLVAPVPDDRGEARYRLLETLRAYGWERLAERGELAHWRARHAGVYLELAERTPAMLDGSGEAAWLGALEREHDNLRAALGWWLERADAEHGLRLAAALGPLWERRAHFAEGSSWLRRLLALPGGDSRHRARALGAAAAIANQQDDYATALRLGEEGLAAGRAAGDAGVVVEVLRDLAAAHRYRREYAQSRRRLEEALALARELGDPAAEVGALLGLGATAADAGDYAAARSFMAECLARGRGMGASRRVVQSAVYLALVETFEGDHAAARRLLAEAVAANRAAGNPMHFVVILGAFASLAAEQGELERALRLIGAAEALGGRIGGRPTTQQEDRRRRWWGRAVGALGQERAEAELAAGRATPLDEALAEALGEPASPTGPLTARQWQVARLVARGLSNKAIGRALVISERTAERHVEDILARLGFASRAQVAAWVAERGH